MKRKKWTHFYACAVNNKYKQWIESICLVKRKQKRCETWLRCSQQHYVARWIRSPVEFKGFESRIYSKIYYGNDSCDEVQQIYWIRSQFSECRIYLAKITIYKSFYSSFNSFKELNINLSTAKLSKLQI